MARTEESGFAGDMAGLLVGQQRLVPLIRGESDGHLGNDTPKDSSETLGQTERGLLPHDINTGGDETPRFGLHKQGTLAVDSKHGRGLSVLTPGALARRESCIRTLMVSESRTVSATPRTNLQLN